MLREQKDVKQLKGEPFRRWFGDEQFDLIVWYAPDRKAVEGFQLCYRLSAPEHALTWRRDRGFFHNAVDDGEGLPFHHKMVPLLVPDGVFDQHRIMPQFLAASRNIDPELVDLIMSVTTPTTDRGVTDGAAGGLAQNTVTD